MSSLMSLVKTMDSFVCRVCGARVKPTASYKVLVCEECASFDNIDLTGCLVIKKERK